MYMYKCARVQMHAGRTFGPLLRYHGDRKGTRDRQSLTATLCETVHFVVRPNVSKIATTATIRHDSAALPGL